MNGEKLYSLLSLQGQVGVGKPTATHAVSNVDFAAILSLIHVKIEVDSGHPDRLLDPSKLNDESDVRLGVFVSETVPRDGRKGEYKFITRAHIKMSKFAEVCKLAIQVFQEQPKWSVLSNENTVTLTLEKTTSKLNVPDSLAEFRR